jgi:CheY-like chemotaxis protein
MKSPTQYQREALGQILKGGQQLLSLVNELLELSVIEAGTYPLVLESQDVTVSITEAFDILNPLATANGVKMIYETPREELFVRADRQRLRQILMNLLSNAVKFNRQGGDVRVTLKAEPASVQIQVRDTGIGVPDEKAPRLFRPFDRLGLESRDIEGTGLGLALSRSLANAMQGDIEYRPGEAEGSVFILTLPRVLDSKRRSKPKAAPTRISAPIGPSKILCIEDNLSNVTLIESLMQDRANTTLLVAMQGRLGLDLAREHLPDVVILDLNLPDISGLQVLSELKRMKETAGTPVIAVSSYATEAQIERAKELGATSYLAKPFSLPELISRLDEALASTQKEAATDRRNAVGPSLK